MREETRVRNQNEEEQGGGDAPIRRKGDLAVGSEPPPHGHMLQPSFVRKPILNSGDAVEVKGRYWVVASTGERFLLRGIAFPVPPVSRRAAKGPHRDDHGAMTIGDDSGSNRSADQGAEEEEQDGAYDDDVILSFEDEYHPEGWIAVLEQLAGDLEINAVRMYRMDCRIDYSQFLDRAAQLGIYVIVPLTGTRGMGVLGRDLVPPDCYPAELFRYGALCVDQFSKHPNVLAGMIGNEVMNNLLTWKSAPCVRAYARDLKLHMARRQKEAEAEAKAEAQEVGREAATNESSPLRQRRRDLGRRHHGASALSYRALPLLYAAQHDSPDASVLPEAAMELTANYLTCDEEPGDSGVTGSYSASTAVDVYGINVESWCSSLQTLESNEDGSEPGYHALYRTFANASFPLVFSETGCSRTLFNRDNGLPRYVRDWKQVPVILNDMNPVLSGFCAYTYDGNPLFRMMGGGDPNGVGGSSASGTSAASWDGVHVLTPSPDYDNFRSQLHLANEELASAATVGYAPGPTAPRLSCEVASANLRQVWKLDLVPIDEMPLYVDTVVPLATTVKKRTAIASAAEPVTSPPAPPAEPEVFPGPGGLSGAKPSLVTMLAGFVLALLCTFQSHRRRRRLSRTGSSDDNPSRGVSSPQQVSLLQRSDGHRDSKSYGAI